MKKILLFGATGNTGVYLVDYFYNNLPRNEYEIIAVGRRTTDFFANQYGIEYISMDVSKQDEFDKLPKDDVYAVYITFAQLPTHEEYVSPHRFVDTNIVGVLNVLEYCRVNNVKKVIYTQTMSGIANVFAKETIIKPNLPKDFPYRGDHTMYVISKNTGEELVKYYHEQFNIDAYIFSIPTIYQYRPNRYWYVAGKKRFRTFHRMIDMACNGDDIEIWGNPNSYKDLVYVKDYCQLLYRSLFTNVKFGVYNVGTGTPTTLAEMLTGIVNVFSPKENPSRIIPCPDKPNTPSYVIDIENAKKELGYEPKYDYIAMLEDFKRNVFESF